MWTGSSLESVHFFYVGKTELWVGRRLLDAEFASIMQVNIAVEGWFNIVYSIMLMLLVGNLTLLLPNSAEDIIMW